MRMSGRILQNREGRQAFEGNHRRQGKMEPRHLVPFELTKGNIAEIKDRYILEQLRSAIDSPWSTALPDGIRLSSDTFGFRRDGRQIPSREHGQRYR